jgi:hypothetical protein
MIHPNALRRVIH